MGMHPQAIRGSLSVMAAKTLVLIVGGNAGIGYEIVKKVATEHPTVHRVLRGCRNTSKGEAAVASMGTPKNVNPIQLDITKDESIELCFKTIEQSLGRSKSSSTMLVLRAMICHWTRAYARSTTTATPST